MNGFYLSWSSQGELSRPDSCTVGTNTFDDCRLVRTGYEKYDGADKDTLIAGVGILLSSTDEAAPDL